MAPNSCTKLNKLLSSAISPWISHTITYKYWYRLFYKLSSSNTRQNFWPVYNEERVVMVFLLGVCLYFGEDRVGRHFIQEWRLVLDGQSEGQEGRTQPLSSTALGRIQAFAQDHVWCGFRFWNVESSPRAFFLLNAQWCSDWYRCVEPEETPKLSFILGCSIGDSVDQCAFSSSGLASAGQTSHQTCSRCWSGLFNREVQALTVDANIYFLLCYQAKMQPSTINIT